MKLNQWAREVFSPESPVIRTVGKYADLMVLNLLWLLCSLPVLTIGASSAALLQAVTAVREDTGRPVRSFFAAFCSKFWKATLIWMIFLAVGCVILYNIVFACAVQASWKLFLIGAWILLAFVYLACLSYVFPVLVKYDLTVWETVKTAFFAGMSKLDITFAVILLNAFPFVLALFFTYYFLCLLVVWLLFGFALIAYADSWLINKVFRMMDPPEDPAEKEAGV
ncbi:MAG: YesL family protein [Faecousia sp.]